MKGKKKLIVSIAVLAGIAILVVIYELLSVRGRTQVQINIHQNKEKIYLSTFAEPPQFAVWLENPETHKCVTVFVTHRVAIGDWEGKANVPVALPRWFELFKVNKDITASAHQHTGTSSDDLPEAVTGATPKDDYFSVRAEVKPGSKWICWVEMNLAGDFNEAFPEQNIESKQVDEFSNGQPALLYRSEITAGEGGRFEFTLAGESRWEEGKNRITPISEGITTAKEVFDKMEVEIIRPKPKLINLQAHL